MGCGIATLFPYSKGSSVSPTTVRGENYILSTSSDLKELKAVVKVPLEQSDPPRMLGKEKYIISQGAVVMDDRPVAHMPSAGILLLYCTTDHIDFTVSYLEHDTRAIFAHSFTDKELTDSKDDAGITFSWGSFFKSLASDVQRQKATVTPSPGGGKNVNFTVTNIKESDLMYKYICKLPLVSLPGDEDYRVRVVQYIVEPMTRMTQIRRRRSEMICPRLSLESLECERVVRSAMLQESKKKVERLLADLKPLREESSVAAQKTMELAFCVNDLRKRLRLLCAAPPSKDPLDVLYDKGGAQYFEHTTQAVKYYPVETDVDTVVLACIRAAFPLPPGAPAESAMDVLDLPELQPLLDNSSRQAVRDVLEILCGIDKWGYDVIRLEIMTNGNSLFYTTYTILYKLDLVARFQLDDATLQRFLLGVQSGYHPNPYHNSMHAADVTQVNYYIIFIAGMKEKCQLRPEEQLGAVLAAAVHDFDHPGLNNNFHTRTNAYLSTLYNDRSILENHHIASVFQLLKHPSYNVLAPLNDEQFRTVRETMVEMVLATDMSNHGTILKRFQSRLVEASDWSANKQDVLVALSMSIKTADLSNCIRPYYIYSEWSSYIAQEFYKQGDEEERSNLSISPFMNRKTSDKDFPEGQKSFITYVVAPMMEAVVMFLPHLRFTLQLCENNRTAWCE